MVSIIVPVYNVSDYIDKCLTSLVNQTYRNIELLLINDGSTDDSYEKCKRWAAQDDRIRLFSKKNEGLGATRNFGLEMSQGEYIMYVDSDDWVDVTIVEKLLNKIEEYNANIAVCDRYDYSSNLEIIEIVKNKVNKEYFEVSEYKDAIYDISTVAWAKLYRKKILIENNIKQPSCKFEDVITPLTLALANRICYVAEPLYNYLRYRAGSITNNLDFIDNVDFLFMLRDEFISYGLFEDFKKQLYDICIFRTNLNVRRAGELIAAEKTRLNQKYESYKQMSNDFLKETFNVEMAICCDMYQNLCVIGSYNLMITGKMILAAMPTDEMKKHFSFSSLISIMSKRSAELLDADINGINEYRKKHIIHDFSKTFLNISKAFFDDCPIIIIDFLEERFDIGYINDSYFTISEAFLESDLPKQLDYKVLKRKQPETVALWRQSCLEFINLLKTRFKHKKVVLVKMKLTEYYGSYGKEVQFENIDEIREINDLLEDYYSFFVDACPEAIVVDVDDSEWYYTDRQFRHGCLPWHLNEQMYREIRKRILKRVEESNNE